MEGAGGEGGRGRQFQMKGCRQILRDVQLVERADHSECIVRYHEHEQEQQQQQHFESHVHAISLSSHLISEATDAPPFPNPADHCEAYSLQRHGAGHGANTGWDCGVRERGVHR
jgi:hypothetical protein